ncbi:MAG: EAL domain-containing protein [Hespellia sp.]|nr:EAL domain-containing protein [Hespellia sp.]
MKKLVLVVDDNAINRKILSRILSSEYDVIEADNGKTALEMINGRTQKISAVLLDLVMPVMDGFEFLEMIQKKRRYRGLPIIVSTGSSDPENEKKALRCGAWDFVTKPYEAEIIRFRLKNAIERSTLHAIQQLHYLSDYDVLTGIYNRSKFAEETDELLRKNTDKKYVLVRFDVERFSLINSYYGSEAGDSLLIHIANELREFAKEQTEITYGRIEADEFAFCTGYEKDIDIEMNIQQMQERIKRFKIRFNLVVPFGVYKVTNHDISVSIMLDNANLAAKQIKGNYVNTYSVYTEDLREHLTSEQEIVNEMAEALANEEFAVYLQPKFSLATNTPSGAEALVRWKHPVKGMISPGEFIPVFERNGFIEKLDYYMWEHTCRLLHRWIQEGREPFPVSVNVSRNNLYNPYLVENICELADKYEVPHELLHIEITESAYTDTPLMIQETIDRFHEFGFVMLMDDFGSGYSSLNILKDIDIDILKIDMKFFEKAKIPGRSESIISSVIRMAKWLNIPVIAEGVESTEQVEFLRSTGCEYVQGFCFAKPMPVEVYEETVKKYQAVLTQQQEYVRRMLIVDSGELNRMMLREIFGDSYEIQIASNGREAIDRINACRGAVDIIILDMQMSVTDGEAFLEYKKSHSEMADIPIIIFTVDESPQMQVKTLAMGADDYITKPFIPEVIRKRVDNVLAGHNRFRQIFKEYSRAIKIAREDSLTGIYNRASAEKMVNQILAEEREKTHAFLMIDVDNFKEINDSMGHKTGDRALLDVSNSLQDFFRSNDIVARLGGDEFGVFMADVPSLQVVLNKCSALMKVINKKVLDGTEKGLEVSIGVALSNADNSSFNSLYQEADIALYKAKGAGKNRVAI